VGIHSYGTAQVSPVKDLFECPVSFPWATEYRNGYMETDELYKDDLPENFYSGYDTHNDYDDIRRKGWKDPKKYDEFIKKQRGKK